MYLLLYSLAWKIAKVTLVQTTNYPLVTAGRVIAGQKTILELLVRCMDSIRSVDQAPHGDDDILRERLEDNVVHALLENIWWITLYVTEDAIATLYGTRKDWSNREKC